MPLLGTVATNSDTGTTTVDVTFNLLSGSTRIMIAMLVSERTNTQSHTSVVIDPAGDNISMTNVAGASAGVWDGSRENRISFWYCLDTNLPSTTGNKTIRGTIGNNADIGLTVFTIRDAVQQAPEDSDVTSSTSTLTLNRTITATHRAFMICGSHHGEGADSTSTGDNQTELSDADLGGGRSCVSYEIRQGAGDETLSHTSDGSTSTRMVLGALSFEMYASGLQPLMSMTPVLYVG